MAYDAKGKEPALLYDDDDFLSMVRSERQNALGLDNGDTLEADRELALDYYKGDMFDMPSAPNRSRAMHTTVSDMIWQALPDLIEIFLGGEDIGSFRPQGEDDEEAAKQQTEIVNNVIKSDNDGFGLVHDYVHDALLMKLGGFHAWIERTEAYQEETLKAQTGMALQMLQQQPDQTEILEVKEAGQDPMVGPLYDVTVGRTKANVCVNIEAFPPEDFAFARDTVNPRELTYAVLRKRPRAQALKQMGLDPDLVDMLPTWNAVDQTLDQARDLAGENDEPRGSSDAVHDLRQVQIHVHVIRIDADGDGKPEIWRLITGEDDATLLDKEKLEAVPFCWGTPYRQPHRAVGRSLADLAIELQRIMTALLRLHLDGGYFALNARHEVDVSRATEHTLSDYLNNTPGFPVRSKGNALTPLVSTKSDFNALDSLEYMATVGETRTGITRNAQGLNPDTLHDTAKGAQALMTNAQKRLRLMARTLAETGMKDLFLLVHSLLRTSGADRPMATRIRKKWVQYDPTSWGERKDFDVEIGMGAGGREMDLQAGLIISNMMQQIVEAQTTGAVSPPIVTPKNIFSFADWQRERLGIKRTTFFTDPESPEGQQMIEAEAQKQAPPDPVVVAKQMELEDKQRAREADREQLILQHDKDVALANIQQQDDMERARIDDADKARAHELALIEAEEKAAANARAHELNMLKEQNAAQKMAEEARLKDRELDLKERELEQGEVEIDLKREEIERGERVERERMDRESWSKAVDMNDRSEERRARANELKAKPEPKPEQKEPKEVAPDRSGEAIGKGLEALAQAMSKPKKIIRGKDGKPEGIA